MLSPDSIIPDPMNPQSYNRYSYVYNNPVNFTDPSGHDGQWCNDPYEGGAGCNTLPQLPDPLVEFTGNGWSNAERTTITQVVDLLAGRMADVYNPIAQFIAKVEGTSYTPLSGSEVFTRFFGGPLTMNKTANGCSVALDCVAWVNDGETSVNFTQGLNLSANPYLVIHEIFHIFDLTILGGAANQALLNAQDNDANFPNRPSLGGPSRERWGFAGSNFSNWQKSRSGLSGEEFADMGIGWTYGRWDANRGVLTASGQARANFMTVNMGSWIYQRLNN